MSRNYYYLVAGLPELVAGSGTKGFVYSSIVDELYEELDSEDVVQVQWIRHKFDNENLINILEKKEHFDYRGNYSKETLEAEITLQETIPSYMVIFLEAQKEGKELYPGLGKREQLFALYYTDLLENDAPFLRNWAELELNVSNVIAAKGAIKLGLSKEKSIVPVNETADRIAKSHANDFGLGGQFEWIEEILSHFDTPLKLEEAIDEVYWKKADEISEGYYFSIETILAFVIKINSIARWIDLDEEQGEAKIEALLAGLKSAVAVGK